MKEPTRQPAPQRTQPPRVALVVAPVLLALLAAVALQHQHGGQVAGWLATLLVLLLAIALGQLVLLPRRRLAIQTRREQVSFDAAPDGIVRVDQNGVIRMVNPAMLKLSGYQREQLLGQNVAMLLPQALRARHAVSIAGYFAQPRTRAMGEAALELLCQDGSLRPVEISLGHWQEGSQRHAIAYVHDLSERHAFERSLQHRATHDDLTGLPNRRLFKALLQQAAQRCGRQASRLSLLFLDLDHFKTINDNFGHGVGDAVLIEAGKRIHSTLRSGDVLARLGGDEFAVLLGELGSPEDAMRVAGKLLEVLKEPYTLRHQQIYSGASIGIAFLPDDAGNVDTLLRYADMAMYQAKQNGRGHFACYSHELNARAHQDMLIHTRLKEALAQYRLQLHYQPQVDVHSGAVRGAEALLRWHDEQLGAVSPERFVAVAEATGLILPLSAWVLEQVCQQICRWQQAGTPLRVAVNFSAHQFNQPDLAQQVADVLQRTGAPAALLEIEITETVVMARPDQARDQIAALVALGCSVALDDFGTGYSSLTRLKDLPVSKLKIDRSFVQGLPGDGNDCTITQAIIGLARSFHLKMIAEGVENAAQLAYLKEQGCELYQGWWFARAMPADALSELLQAPHPAKPAAALIHSDGTGRSSHLPMQAHTPERDVRTT